MDITQHINDFVKQNQRRRNKPYYKICKNLLVGGKPYSLNSQTNYTESEYLPSNIRDSVAAYSSNKDIKPSEVVYFVGWTVAIQQNRKRACNI